MKVTFSSKCGSSFIGCCHVALRTQVTPIFACWRSLTEHSLLSCVYLLTENDTQAIFRISCFSQKTDAIQRVPQHFHGDRLPFVLFSTTFVTHNLDYFDQFSAHVTLSFKISFHDFIKFRDYWILGLCLFSDTLNSNKEYMSEAGSVMFNCYLKEVIWVSHLLYWVR
jgi:hypothetical protein